MTPGEEKVADMQVAEGVDVAHKTLARTLPALLQIV